MDTKAVEHPDRRFPMQEQPWFKQYDEGVPHTLAPYPERTLVDVVSESARLRPQHPALLFKGNKLTYGDLDQLSDALSRSLTNLGDKPSDRVALLLPNTPQLLIALLGIWKAGAIVVPMNPLYTESELEHAFRECGAETVIVLTLFYEKAKAIQKHTNIRNIIATNIKEFLPAPK